MEEGESRVEAPQRGTSWDGKTSLSCLFMAVTLNTMTGRFQEHSHLGRKGDRDEERERGKERGEGL